MKNLQKNKKIKPRITILILLILMSFAGLINISLSKYTNINDIGTINLTVTPPPKILATGIEFNMKLKGSDSISTSDNTITRIVFDYWSYGYSSDGVVIYEESDWESGIAIDEEAKGAIRLFKSDNGATAYILSESDIYANYSCLAMFRYFKAVAEIVFNNFDTEKVTDMQMMFNGCLKLSNLDLSGFETSKVKNMSQMFGESRADNT